jgi:hypothetical protein
MRNKCNLEILVHQVDLSKPSHRFKVVKLVQSSSIIRPFTTFVVDKKHSLAMELKDDSKLRIEDAVGQTIYSTSRRTVEDSIFKFDIVSRLFQDEDGSIKRWLDDDLKIVDDNKHGKN